MIINGASRKNRRFFARHLLNSVDNDRVRVVEFRGFANENVKAAPGPGRSPNCLARCSHCYWSQWARRIRSAALTWAPLLQRCSAHWR